MQAHGMSRVGRSGALQTRGEQYGRLYDNPARLFGIEGVLLMNG